MPRVPRASVPPLSLPSSGGSGSSSGGSRRWRASTVRRLLLFIAIFAYASLIVLFGSVADVDVDVVSQRSPSPPENDDRRRRPRATIAYAVSLTSCGDTGGGQSSDPSFREGAAVLRHSIHLSSIRNYENSGSVFDYEMIAFVHPDAVPCSEIFRELGYELQIRETPFNATDIKGEFLREHIVKSGCCGEREYLKLYSYRLTDYPIVVHLDLDSLILRPLDDLFLAMLGEGGGGRRKDEGGGGGDDWGETVVAKAARSRVPVMFDNPLPPSSSIDAYFTRDYNMVHPGHKHVGVQGGFLVIRPNVDAFDEYVNIVIEGKFVKGGGWYGEYGGYFGAQQIQGICSFYYDYKHPGTGVELNRCYYNAMADSPRQDVRGVSRCRDGREDCQDCRNTPIEEIKSVHFTLCSKPWKCPLMHGGSKDLCAKFHAEWFRVREDLDRTRAKEGGWEYSNPGGKEKPEIFRGYCNGPHEGGYVPIGGGGHAASNFTT